MTDCNTGTFGYYDSSEYLGTAVTGDQVNLGRTEPLPLRQFGNSLGYSDVDSVE